MFLDVQLRHAHRSVVHRPENCRSPSVIRIAPKMGYVRLGGDLTAMRPTGTKEGRNYIIFD
jgi:hypothetical protein